MLSNQLVFKIADRVPTSAAAVISCCPPVPPLVYSHAAALGQIVAEAAETARARGAPEATVVAAEGLPSRSVKDLLGEPKVAPAPSLWTSNPATPSATSSALFGPPARLVATTSSLFGNARPIEKPAQVKVREALAKLANVLHLAATAAVNGTSTPDASGSSSDEDELPDLPHAAEKDAEVSADHVFVPKSQRAKEEEDDVVVVSKMKDAPKKRKRVKDESSSQAAGVVAQEQQTPKPKKKKKAKVTAADVKPFDYASEPTVLDAPAPTPTKVKREDTGKKRKKDEFGSAPRKMTEPKTGNLTMRYTR